MTIVEFLQAIDGIGQIWAQDGQFLGLLSSNPNDPNSIINPTTYGNSYSYTSIKNSYSSYGGAYGVYSPYNHYCPKPPVILYQGQAVLVVTRNSYAQTNGLPVVDPDTILGIYSQLSQQYVSPLAMQLQSLHSSRMTSSQALNNTAQIAANMFR